MGRRDRRRRGRARAGLRNAVGGAPDARGVRAPGGGGLGAVAPRRRVVHARRERAVLVDVGAAVSPTQLYRAHLADGGVRRVRVRLEGGARYVEGDRYPLEVPVAEAVAAHGRSRGWDVVAVSAPLAAR